MVLDKSGYSVQLPPLPVTVRDSLEITNMIDIEGLTVDEGKKILNELVDLDN